MQWWAICATVSFEAQMITNHREIINHRSWVSQGQAGYKSQNSFLLLTSGQNQQIIFVWEDTPLPFWHRVLINELPSSNWLILIFDCCQKVLRRRKRLSDNHLMAFRPYRLKMCRFRRLWAELLLISISFSGPKTREALVTGCTLQNHGLKLRPPLGWFIWPSPHQTWNWPHGHSSIWPFIKRIAPTVVAVDLLPAWTAISFGISLGEGA